MKLDKEQKESITGILDRIKSGEKETSLVGFAGSGKSVVIANLVKMLPNFAVCSFTGKAASNLRSKGIENSSTIHSLIYKPRMVDGKIFKDKYGNPVFIKAPDLDVDGFIVDEASMIGKTLYDDLKSFNLPILWVGDNGQLPSIGTEALDVLKNPNFVLQTIHRNAGEIAHFCFWIRQGYRPEAFKSKEGKVRFINQWQADKLLTEMDQIIVAFNRSRVLLNKRVREKMGRVGDFPMVGDRVLCLSNRKPLSLFNGMDGSVTWVDTKKQRMYFTNDDDKTWDIKYDNQFNQIEYDTFGGASDPVPFDFSYVKTCHKCQGSEYEKVMVFQQTSKHFDKIRWNYTACSRAQKLLYFVS